MIGQIKCGKSKRQVSPPSLFDLIVRLNQIARRRDHIAKTLVSADPFLKAELLLTSTDIA